MLAVVPEAAPVAWNASACPFASESCSAPRVLVPSSSTPVLAGATVNVTVTVCGDCAAPDAVTVRCPVYVTAVRDPTLAVSVAGALPLSGDTVSQVGITLNGIAQGARSCIRNRHGLRSRNTAPLHLGEAERRGRELEYWIGRRGRRHGQGHRNRLRGR
jgi:hypothetical protein